MAANSGLGGRGNLESAGTRTKRSTSAPVLPFAASAIGRRSAPGGLVLQMSAEDADEPGDIRQWDVDAPLKATGTGQRRDGFFQAPSGGIDN